MWLSNLLCWIAIILINGVCMWWWGWGDWSYVCIFHPKHVGSFIFFILWLIITRFILKLYINIIFVKFEKCFFNKIFLSVYWPYIGLSISWQIVDKFILMVNFCNVAVKLKKIIILLEKILDIRVCTLPWYKNQRNILGFLH